MRIWIALLAAPILLGLAQTAGAEEEARAGRRGRCFWRSERVVENLALTPEQTEQLEADEASFEDRGRELTKQWSEIRGSLRETLAAEQFSLEQANRLRDELAKLAAERSTLNTERQIAIRRVLTAEQWAGVETGRKRMGEKMMRRMRPGHRGETTGTEAEPEETE